MTNRYSLMFISCWVFFPLESAGNLSLTADGMLLSFNSSTYWGEKVPLSNILSSHQLSVCYSDPSSRTSDFPLGKRELDFFPLRYQQGKKKNSFTSQGHLMQQISTSNQFISKALSKLLSTRFWCKNPSVLSAWITLKSVCTNSDFSFLLSEWNLTMTTISNLNPDLHLTKP